MAQFQPIWKIWSSNWVKLAHFPKDRGENKEYFKPQPSFFNSPMVERGRLPVDVHPSFTHLSPIPIRSCSRKALVTCKSAAARLLEQLTSFQTSLAGFVFFGFRPMVVSWLDMAFDEKASLYWGKSTVRKPQKKTRKAMNRNQGFTLFCAFFSDGLWMFYLQFIILNDM